MEKNKKSTAKINPKGFDPKKYIDIEPTMSDRTMSEQKDRSAVLTFGRFSPPTIGSLHHIHMTRRKILLHMIKKYIFFNSRLVTQSRRLLQEQS